MVDRTPLATGRDADVFAVDALRVLRRTATAATSRRRRPSWPTSRGSAIHRAIAMRRANPAFTTDEVARLAAVRALIVDHA